MGSPLFPQEKQHSFQNQPLTNRVRVDQVPNDMKTKNRLNLFYVITFLSLFLLLPVVSRAQINTNLPPQPAGFSDLWNTITGYLTSLNTNYVTTFGLNRFDLWAGVSSIQNGPVPIVNDLGFSYDLWRSNLSTNTGTIGGLSLETVVRNSGVAGTLTSGQIGMGASVIIVDTKLIFYVDGGNEVYAPGIRPADRWYGEIGLRVKKAFGLHTYSGVGVADQFPHQRQVLSAFAGFTF